MNVAWRDGVSATAAPPLWLVWRRRGYVPHNGRRNGSASCRGVRGNISLAFQTTVRFAAAQQQHVPRSMRILLTCGAYIQRLRRTLSPRTRTCFAISYISAARSRSRQRAQERRDMTVRGGFAPSAIRHSSAPYVLLPTPIL